MLNMRQMADNAAIASIFQISSFPVPSKNTPKLNETQPLTLFYHTHTEYLKTLLVMLKNVNKRKFLKTLEKLRMKQKLVLDSLELVFRECDQTYRKKPANLHIFAGTCPLRKRFSEKLLYMARLVAHGFMAQGYQEEECNILQPPAQELVYRYEQISFIMYARCQANSLWPYSDILHYLEDFDKSWTTFERISVELLVNREIRLTAKNKAQRQIFIDSIVETIQIATEKNYVSLEQVAELDASLFFYVPRITILHGLKKREAPIPNTSKTLISYFNGKEETINQIFYKLKNITNEAYEALFQKLLGGGSDVAQDDCSQFIYKEVCQLSDSLHSGPESSNFLQILKHAFIKYNNMASTD